MATRAGRKAKMSERERERSGVRVMSVHNADADAGSRSMIPGADQSSPSPALIEQAGSICHAKMHLGESTLEEN